MLAAQGDEQVPLTERARIARDPAKGRIGAVQRASGHGRERGEIAHHEAAPNASSTTARSLNGRRSWPDDLVVLVPLACDHDDVAGLRLRQRMTDRVRAIGNHDRARWLAHAGHDLLEDRPRILGARIVVGEHDRVGELLGDRAHLRTLAGVAIAATAEHAVQATARMRARRIEKLGERVRGVGVVDDRDRMGAAAEHFHPARRSLARADRGERLLQRHAPAEQYAERRQAGSRR